MDLRLTKNGHVFYKVDPTLAAILCEALPSVFEQVNQPARQTVDPSIQHNPVNLKIPFYSTPTWDIGVVASAKDGNKSYVITLGTGRDEYIYPSSPDGALAHFGRIGFTVPKDILDRYRRLYKYTGPVIPQASYGVAANRKTADELEAIKQTQKEAAIERESAPLADSTGTFGISLEPLREFPKRDGSGRYL
jgi:hypothetical protein